MVSLRPQFGHLPGLDGLRGTAVAIVLVAHLGFHRFVPGGFGVTLFFFISGMLISRLLLAEHAANGRIGLLKFYARRFLRLYPALLLAVLAHWLLYPLVGGQVTGGEIAAALLYYANYYNQLAGFGSAGGSTYGAFHPLGVQWSLAIEEQYYIIFPLLMIMLRARVSRLLWLFWGVALASLLWRLYLQAQGWGDRNYSSTDTRLDSIIYGALLTVMLAGPRGAQVKAFMLHRATLALAVVVMTSTFLLRDEAFRNTVRYSMQGLALMPVVCWVVFAPQRGRLHALLSSRVALLMGAWSYSLYLFHGHAVLIAENVFKVSYMAELFELPAGFYLLSVVLTFVFALVSYYGVEQRFIGLRSRVGSHVKSD